MTTFARTSSERNGRGTIATNIRKLQFLLEKARLSPKDNRGTIGSNVEHLQRVLGRRREMGKVLLDEEREGRERPCVLASCGMDWVDDSLSYSSASEEIREPAPWENPDILLGNWKELLERHNKEAEKMISGAPVAPIGAREFCEIFAKVRKK